jgi:hypothetical protein
MIVSIIDSTAVAPSVASGMADFASQPCGTTVQPQTGSSGGAYIACRLNLSASDSIALSTRQVAFH